VQERVTVGRVGNEERDELFGAGLAGVVDDLSERVSGFAPAVEFPLCVGCRGMEWY